MCRVLGAVYSLRWKPLISMPFDDIVEPSLLHQTRWLSFIENGLEMAKRVPYIRETSLFILSLSKKRKEWKRVSDGLCLMSGVRPRRFSLLPLAPLFTTSFNENLTHRQTHRQKKLASRVTFWYDRSGRKKTKELERGRDSCVNNWPDARPRTFYAGVSSSLARIDNHRCTSID